MERIIRTQNILELRDVCRTFADGAEVVRALDNVNLNVKAGEFVALMGSSGSGKTTLLSAVGLIDRPDSGRVYFNGERVDLLDESERSAFRRQNIGFIFQFFNLIPELTARGNVMLPLLLENVPWSVAKARADEMLATLGLQGKENRYSDQLSGGQQQRVAVARALAKDSFLILADEPTAHLDSQNSEQLIQMVSDLAREYRVTVIFATHDPEIAKKAGRIITIRDGKLQEVDQNALISLPYAERGLGRRKELLEEQEMEARHEERRSRRISRLLMAMLVSLTLSSALVINSFYEFIPSLVIPQVRNVFTGAVDAVQAAIKTLRFEQREEELNKDVERKAVNDFESEIVTLYGDLLKRQPSQKEMDKWLEKEYTPTALRFEFVKSKEYQDYLLDSQRKKGYKAALDELVLATFEDSLPSEIVISVSGLPLGLARRALVKSSVYQKYLAAEAATVREAEIEYIFESSLDRAPTGKELRDYAESTMFLDDIRRDILKKAKL